MSRDFVVIIPARYASSRLPGKPMLSIAGKPMIQHVYERACLSDASAVYIATDHADIMEAAKGFGAKAVMTKESHQSGTDRLQEVAQNLGLSNDQIVVNVQGDEPLIPPEVINQTAALLFDANSQTRMATLFEACDKPEQVFDANVVKVVTSELAPSGVDAEQGIQSQQALYFSRAAIAHNRDVFAANDQAALLQEPVLSAWFDQQLYKRHLGIYAYRVSLLHDFISWPEAALEQVEKLEQLRAMANGVQINIAKAIASMPPGVDTQADLDAVKAILE